MEKITFVNGQEPALSSTNLNKIQDNVENAINEVNEGLTSEIDNLKIAVLYENESGTYGGFTLNDDLSNYKYCEIIYMYGGKQGSTGKFIAKNGTATITATSNVFENGGYYLKTISEPITFSGMSAIRNEAYVSRVQVNASAASGSVASGSELVHITHVLGYK